VVYTGLKKPTSMKSNNTKKTSLTNQ